MYKLSPSDFAYLYEECKLCYYLKIKMSIQRPSMPFPGVFSALNTRLQGALIGKELQELSPVLPQGSVESQEGFIESMPVPNTKVYIKGKYDLLVRQPDGTRLIIDFKISQPSEEKIAKYETQLQAYHYAFEHPSTGETRTITKMGLIIMYPDQTKFENGRAVMDFPPQWFEIDIKKDFFLQFMAEVSSLLEGPTPPENPNCKWCKYRHLGEVENLMRL
ncbi:PD-(D/E)XK nuclease family protein [Patescibacteria group bacterium]|nr:PD-(D/E)XK nuclease family protein [Patescibacteria group bacterium]MBU1472826.1 PD-(D/E)XK nuclease family protein [Patescibacteria group bacterium]MBU2460366.1 PD-(D/E)XK nuclease family protein [Patescibacteria group bacterium]MBU2543882.1 PD-(D/E)XK nuclease family protein [Patescibacteria group bacterium]